MNWRSYFCSSPSQSSYAKDAKVPQENPFAPFAYNIRTSQTPKPAPENLPDPTPSPDPRPLEEPLKGRVHECEDLSPAGIIGQAIKDGVVLALSASGKISAKGQRSAIDRWLPAIRQSKATIIAELMAEPPLEGVLKGQAIELWSDSLADRFWLVADEADALKLGEPRGTIYTASEARRICAVGDTKLVAEIHDWKRRFDGIIRED